MVLPRLRAPRENRGILAVPSLAEWPQLLESNRHLSATHQLALGERSLHDLRRLARQEALHASTKAHALFGLAPPGSDLDLPWIATGHQPELFHPGVWLKNYAIGRLARNHGLVPINVIIDSDAVKKSAIRVPRAAGGALYTRTVSLDRAVANLPFEEWCLQQPEHFARVPEEVSAAVEPLGWKPIMAELWENQCRCRSAKAAELFSGMRRRWEDQWSCHNHEVFLGDVCRSEAFSFFAVHLAANAERFLGAHNTSLQEYGSQSGAGRQGQPFAPLRGEEEWREVPFWVWRADEPRRERLFARFGPDGISLKGETLELPALPSVAGHRLEDAARAWRDLESLGYRVRTRAIGTMIFVRLFLCDLFVHGLGGGLYDEVTDQVLWRFYGIAPPAYAVITGTLYLPFPEQSHTPGTAGGDLGRYRQRLRDLWYNPERYLSAAARRDPRIKDCSLQKRDWLARDPSNRRERSRRFHALHNLNAELRPAVAHEREALAQRISQLEEQGRALRIVHDREWAYCLYPGDQLQSFFESVGAS